MKKTALPHLKHERQYWKEGKTVAGLDEVGRGCIAGPVVAACVIPNPRKRRIKGVNDSKLLSAKKRKELFDGIINSSLDFGVGLATAQEIDEIGIRKAIDLAMERALGQVSASPHVLLIDGRDEPKLQYEKNCIIGGDRICYSIAAASIVAKVFRDQVVSGLDPIYQGYSFSIHKGYATKKHQEELLKDGPTPEHRMSFLGRWLQTDLALD